MPGIIIAWVIVSLSVIFHTVITMMLAVYPSRTVASGRVTENINGEADNRNSLYLDLKSRGLATTVQAVTLVGGVIAAAYAVSSEDAGIVIFVAVAGIGLLIWGLPYVVISCVLDRYRDNLHRVFRPLVWGFNILSSASGAAYFLDFVTKPRTMKKPTEEANATIREGFSLLEEADASPQEGELQMIRGILRMDDVKVREIMRPRPDIVAAPLTASLYQIATLMTRRGYSKIPVYGDSLDDIRGVAHTRDIMGALQEGKEKNSNTLTDLLRPPMSVPESQNLEILLKNFRKARTSIAAVFDEHGGLSGIVTVTDLVEEIFGEMMDEFDQELPEVEILKNGDAEVDAGTTVYQLNQVLGSKLEFNGVDTVGGVVYHELGNMPKRGDEVSVDGVRLTVQSISGRRIRRVRARRYEETPDTA